MTLDVEATSDASGAGRHGLWAGAPEYDVSIVIINWNTRERLARCLGSVFEHTADCRFEVIVVDNGSADGSVEMVRESFPLVRVIANAENRGYAIGCNQGMRAARGRWFLLLNSDTLLQENVVARLHAYAEGHPEAGMVGIRLEYEDGAPQGSCGWFPSVWMTVVANFRLGGLVQRILHHRTYFWPPLLSYEGHSREQEVDWIHGGCMIVRREAAAAAGLMDEAIFLFAEEWDWCYRIKAAGWRIRYTPSIRLMHVGSASWTMSGSKRVRALLSSQRYFFAKHYGAGPAFLFKAITAVGSSIKAAALGLLGLVFVFSPRRRACFERMRWNLTSVAWCLSLQSQDLVRAKDVQSPALAAEPAAHA